jgi:hypothetical protein
MTPIHLRSQWWAVECPPDSIDHQTVHISPGIDVVHCYVPGEYAENKSYCINLPPGNWQILCTLKECTEEQAKKIVEYYDNGFGATIYRNFDDQGLYGARPLLFWKAIESLHSLIRARKLNTETNILILQNTDTALQSWNQKEGV